VHDRAVRQLDPLHDLGAEHLPVVDRLGEGGLDERDSGHPARGGAG
jgi:hypothetical protein